MQINTVKTFLIKKKEPILLAILLLISGVAHGYNMFHFPYYENDEGTYMSQAWSLLNQGKLSPYTYWYDHAPAGWMLIALWVKLTGGFFTFGTSVNSGRVLMLLLHLGISYFLFFIAKKLSKGYLAGIIAIVIFSLSPLGIYFQRRVLLDNIMIFWVLLSLAMLLRDKLKLSQVIISAVFFGIGVLTKENAIFFIPAFLYVIFSRSKSHNRIFALLHWLAVTGAVSFTYIIYASLKGELFPAGFTNNSAHVSLITTLQNQLARGSKYPFWDVRSDFYINLVEWIRKDSFTIITGALATLFSVILSLKNKSLRIPAFLSVLFWIFLLRGKLVIDFYIVPLFPLMTLNIGLLIDHLSKMLSFNKKALYYAFGLSFVSASSIYLLMHPIGQYTNDETTPQTNALSWIFKNVPTNGVIAIDDFAEVEFREKGYKNAYWFWKVWYDPEVQNKYGNDWKNIQYLFMGHEMLRQMGFRLDEKDDLRNVLVNSDRSAVYGPNNSGTYVDIDNYITTNGDWSAIFALKTKEQIILNSSWRHYKKNFIHSYGQVIDLQSGNTTSEGQAYTLLRAVWMNDRKTFDGVWLWTKDHMQHRNDDKLFSWLWVKDGDSYKLEDTGFATDADEDIALALIFAYKVWGDEYYLKQAEEIINDIWNKAVVEINGRYYLISGTGANVENGYLINPSYLSPASYKIFAMIDKNHPWEELAKDSYIFLNEISGLSSIGLPPNWVFVDGQTGEIHSAAAAIEGEDASFYGYDAFRVMWRVSLDAKWFDSEDANKYLEKMTPFFDSAWTKNHNFYAIYDTLGNPVVDFSSLSTSAGALSTLAVTKPVVAEEIQKVLYEDNFNFEEGFWGDKNNYYDQNWAWFASALYYDALPNLWRF